MIIAAALEAPAVISSFDDIAVMCEAIAQRGGFNAQYVRSAHYGECAIFFGPYRGPARSSRRSFCLGLRVLSVRH